MVTYKIGDIFCSDADIIAHQVNCQGASGRGIAGQIDKKFPEASKMYKTYTNKMIEKYKGETEKLLGEICISNNSKPMIVHLYGQNYYGHGLCHTNYLALQIAMQRLYNWIYTHKEMCNSRSFVLAFPYGLGSGNAGGDWTVVDNIIHKVYAECNFNVQIWKLDDTEPI